MKKVLAVIMVLTLFANAGYAAFSSADLGTSAASFLKLGAGARPAAMGNCYGAVANDSTAIYWNPAGLAQVDAKDGSATLMHAAWFQDISYEWASYARPIENWGVVGIGVQYLSYGSLNQTDISGLDVGTFTPNGLAISLGYARSINGFDLGANVKYISSTILNTASAYAVDLGAMRRFWNNKLSLGVSMQNMGTSLQYESDQEPLPFNIRVGAAYKIQGNWLIASDLNAPIDGPQYYGFGTEYMQRLSPEVEVGIRAGYNTQNVNTGGSTGFTAGLGVKYLDYSIDYAFVPYGNLGSTNRISLSVEFR